MTQIYIVSAIWLIALIITARLDIKHKDIPVFIFPTVGVLSVAVNMIFTKMDKTYLISAGIGMAVMFLLMLILAIICRGGGADVIMMTAMGASITVKYCFEVLIISYVPMIIYTLIMLYKRKSQSIEEKKADKLDTPLIPFILFGFIVDFIYNMIKLHI